MWTGGKETTASRRRREEGDHDNDEVDAHKNPSLLRVFYKRALSMNKRFGFFWYLLMQQNLGPLQKIFLRA